MMGINATDGGEARENQDNIEQSTQSMCFNEFDNSNIAMIPRFSVMEVKSPAISLKATTTVPNINPGFGFDHTENDIGN